MRPRRWTFEAAAIGVAVLMILYLTPRHTRVHHRTLPDGQVLFGDFIAFWSAGRATLDGHLARIHDPSFLWTYQRAVAPDTGFCTDWNSPPTFLAVACALALLPYALAAVVFLVATFAIYLLAARRLLPDRRALIFAATAPAAVYHLMTVQAGLLLSGLTGLALHWLDRRPRVAGTLVGLLAIKPHLAILWPVFLAVSGRWRTFLAASVATLLFVLAAGAAFGFDSYARFFEGMSSSARLILGQQISTPAYASLYSNLRGLHVPHLLALAAHGVSAGAALTVSLVVFRRGDRVTGGAALCAATLLLSPYLFYYDSLVLLMGAALLGTPRNRLELFAAILAWGAGLTTAIGYVLELPICPLAAWTLLIAALRRREATASPADLHSVPGVLLH